MRSDIKCDIIIPVWNELSLTKKCIASIKANTVLSYRIIVVDNASDEETAIYLKGLSSNGEITLLRNNENFGFPKAVNQGIASSAAEYICVLNNDTEPYRGWLKEMVGVAESDPTIGIVNPSSNNLGQKKYEAGFSGKWIEMASCIGFCMLIKREVIQRIGNLDEVYSPGNFEDTDFSKRAIHAGYKCVMAKGAYVYHKENTSFKKRKDWDKGFKKNRDIFHERWGRPKRVAYIISSDKQIDPGILKASVNKFLKNGDWVWILSKKSFQKIDRYEHASLRLFELDKWGFTTKVLWRILKRKKRFDSLITDSRFFTAIFRLFGYLVQNI